MIVYRKGISLRVLLRMSGSVMPGAALFALTSALLTLFFELVLPRAYLAVLFDHPYPFQPMAHIVAFALVFRTNVAYNRYWESCTQVALMSAKWGDAVSEALSFDELDKPGASATQKSPLEAESERSLAHRQRRHSQALVINRASLMHALAIQYLRRDDDLTRLRAATPTATGLAGLLPLADTRAEDQTGDHLDEAMQSIEQPQHHTMDITEFTQASGLASHFGAIPASLNEPHSADEKVAESVLTATNGDASSLTEQHSADAKPQLDHAKPQVADNSLPSPNVLSLEIFEAMQRQRGTIDTGIAWPDLPVLGGVAPAELAQLLLSEDRVGFVFSRMMMLINTRRLAGGLWVEAPVLSRVYQVLSDGMLGFRQARKIEDVPFPWPYAQMVAFLLLVFSSAFPLLVASQIGSQDNSGTSIIWLPPLLAFLTILAHTGLYKTARMLEDPFVCPPNDLPSVAMQKAFNARLIAGWDALRHQKAGDCQTGENVGAASSDAWEADRPEGMTDEEYYNVLNADKQAVELWRSWDHRHVQLNSLANAWTNHQKAGSQNAWTSGTHPMCAEHATQAGRHDTGPNAKGWSQIYPQTSLLQQRSVTSSGWRHPLHSWGKQVVEAAKDGLQEIAESCMEWNSKTPPRSPLSLRRRLSSWVEV